MKQSIQTFFRRLEPFYDLLAILLTLTLGLALARSAWQITAEGAKKEASSRFEAHAADVSNAITGRMLDYGQVLKGASGLFSASESVERHEWHAYVSSLRIDLSYPGIQALAFMQRVPASRLGAHIAEIRRQGFPQYRIWPEGSRDEYFPLMYVEPFANRNPRALGFDGASENARRVAMERARTTGEPVITSKVRLAQDSEDEAEPGVVMFLPIYERRAASPTIANAAQVQGYATAIFHMNDLMQGVLRADFGTRLRIYDGEQESPGSLLYDSGDGSEPSERTAMFNSATRVRVSGREWLLRVSSLPGFEETVDRSIPNIVLTTGVVISLMLTLVIWLLANTRRRAVRLARGMNAELIESRERLGRALDGSNLALFDWDIGTGRVQLGERWQAILGGAAAPTETNIATLESMVHPDDIAGLRKQLYDVLNGRARFYAVEHRVRDHNGEWKWILSRAKVAERDRTGAASRITGTNADITDRKEIERIKNEFIGTVSHELRTPLTALIGALGLLKAGSAGKLPEDADLFLNMACENSERLAALINDILDLEKMEAGKMQFRMEPLDLGSFLERAIELNRPYGEKFGVHFELVNEVPGLRIHSDRDRLLQVITNLMSNAAKYSPAGEMVTISTRLDDGWVRVSVADRGPGIPAEFHSRIFAKFAQADSSNTRSKEGTGLGLSICKAIIDRLGRRLGFESIPGKGATFYFELPVSS